MDVEALSTDTNPLTPEMFRPDLEEPVQEQERGYEYHIQKLREINVGDLNSLDAYELRSELREEGSSAARYIIKHLQDTAQTNHISENGQILQGLYFCATEAEAQEIANLLMSLPNYCDHDLFNILRRIGKSNAAGQILRRTDTTLYNLDGGGYSEVSKHSAVLDALRTLAPIYGRTEDETEKNRVWNVIENIRHNSNANLSDDFQIDFLSLMAIVEDFKPQYVNERYERFFQPPEQTPDEDFYNDDYDDYTGYGDDNLYNVEPAARISTIRNLHQIASNEIGAFTMGDDAYEQRLERLEFQEANAPKYMPTLGIEIEIFARTLPLPPKPHTLAPDNEREQYDRVAKEVRKDFEKAEDAGVPMGDDAFWEFANEPVQYYGTLSREVQALIANGLINTEFTRHPMHLTIGGITNEGENGQQAYVLARALEAAGWSTTGGRLLKPLKTGTRAWLAKGYNGLKHRTIMDGETAVEIRTLQFQGLGGLDRTLRSAYFLGAALKAYQKDEAERDVVETELARTWENFSERISHIFQHFGADDPAKLWMDSGSSDMAAGFVKMAELMNQSLKEPVSEGAKFVGLIQDAIIHARMQVKSAVNETELVA